MKGGHKPRVPKALRLDTVIGVRVTDAEAKAIRAACPAGKSFGAWIRTVVLARLGIPRNPAGFEGAKEAGLI